MAPFVKRLPPASSACIRDRMVKGVWKLPAADRSVVQRAIPRGFSLVELVVVMALVMVLYALAYGPSSAAIQARKREQCLEQLKQIHSLLRLYASEHEGAFPEADGPTSDSALSRLVPVYTTDTSVFICPGSSLPPLPAAKPFAGQRISYAYCAGLKRDDDPNAILVADCLVNPRLVLKGDPLFSTSGTGPGNNHRNLGGNVLFVDGHVESVPAIAERPLAIPAGATVLNPKP